MAKKTSLPDPVDVRILCITNIDGLLYQPDDVVQLSANLAEQHVEAGNCDPNSDAVSYCMNELGKTPIVHVAPVIEAAPESTGNAGE